MSFLHPFGDDLCHGSKAALKTANREQGKMTMTRCATVAKNFKGLNNKTVSILTFEIENLTRVDSCSSPLVPLAPVKSWAAFSAQKAGQLQSLMNFDY
jgi:hypothetical protein